MVKNNLPKVDWIGAHLDLSGYAQAARGYALSLDAVGVDVRAEVREFEEWKQRWIVDITVPRRLYTLLKIERPPTHTVIHLTPDNYHQYTNRQQPLFGYYAWETSKLPPKWVRNINAITEKCFVPSTYLKEVSLNSGVNVPVEVLPHAIPCLPEDWTPKATILNYPEDKFKFYSIFQWSERKNPINLLRAYYEEFSSSDDVIMILKTYYRSDNTSDRDFIRKEISRLKRATKGVKCPPVLLIEEMLGYLDIMSLHYYCDCYVTMTRNEGFCLPLFESMSMGNSVIAPNYSAFAEYLTNEMAYLVDIEKEVSVGGMKHISPLYTSNMIWSEPSLESCREQMRTVYNNRALAKEKGKTARAWVEKNLSYEAIGNKTLELLKV